MGSGFLRWGLQELHLRQHQRASVAFHWDPHREREGLDAPSDYSSSPSSSSPATSTAEKRVTLPSSVLLTLPSLTS